jgi:hypothetical protein
MSELENQINPEEYNKQILKQAAVTFSMEGISRDLKFFIQKKMSHNKVNISYLTQLFELALTSEVEGVSEIPFKKGSTLKNFLDHVFEEVVKTDQIINQAIGMVFEKESKTKKPKE